MPAGAHRNQQKKIDSNNIATVFRKGNAITKLLTDALEKENAGKTGVYYWKKKEARDLFESAGVQFPGSAVQDGLSCSILVADNPVNGNFAEQAWKLCSLMRKERKKRWKPTLWQMDRGSTPKGCAPGIISLR